MAWEWRFEKADGSVTEPATPPGEFGTQGDAETWVGEVWKELVEEGIDQVTLVQDGTVIYGPMSLHEQS
ncbi:hypothetical protein PJ985_20510 [Streptomyces sp. ACA25]|uniref:hypothetical protein n=1 Tax=Streptomyces sp. ACA25 TaxID=3022596 RepID=UPI0023071363|nr:hypothetical protein [Streptomyces sp. ACA25]MDB1089944.1 hypothetical protein [Streptomyces sp. ACA25]